MAQRRVAARIRAGAAPPSASGDGGRARSAVARPVHRRGRGLGAGDALVPGRRSVRHGDHDRGRGHFDLADCPTIASPTLLIAGGRDRFYDLAHPRGDRRERSAPSVSRLLAPVGPRVWRNSQRAGRRGERRGAASRSPAAAPSRASLLTGHYPSLHGVTQTDGLSKSADNPVYEARLRHLAPDVRSGNTRARLSGTRVRSLGHQLTNQRERGGVDQFHQTQLRLAPGHGQHCMTSLCCPRAIERERDWPDRAPEGGRPPRDDVIVHLPPQRAR